MITDEPAEVYHYDREKQIHYVKIEPFPGMFISGIQVKPSRYKRPWVEMPKFQKPDKTWGHYIEFRPSAAVREEIEQMCLKAVEAYNRGSSQSGPSIRSI